MVYYTQLIYIRENGESLFHEFEDHVLPLLSEYEGDLQIRLRPGKNEMIAASIEPPYEIHLVSFPSRQHFLSYAADERRQQYLRLKDQSVLRVVLIEGTII